MCACPGQLFPVQRQPPVHHLHGLHHDSDSGCNCLLLHSISAKEEEFLMDVLQALATRRSVRHYTEQSIEEEKLELVLEAARLSPSASNQQNWKFIVVRDSVTRRSWSRRVLDRHSSAKHRLSWSAAARIRMRLCSAANTATRLICRLPQRILSCRHTNSVSARAGSDGLMRPRLNRFSVFRSWCAW